LLFDRKGMVSISYLEDMLQGYRPMQSTPRCQVAQAEGRGERAAGGLVQARAHRDALKAWLVDHAYPLWWRAGVDHRRGGFHEALDQAGRPLRGPRRARVQPRQVYAFAVAASLGWDGPWASTTEHGLAYVERCYRRPDGPYRTLVSESGAPLNDTAFLYDQAFVLFGQAAAFRALPQRTDLLTSASELCDVICRDMKSRSGGFHSAAGLTGPALSNPHMHLLEAALAWFEASEAPSWKALAREIAALALTAFIDPSRGCLREAFSADWSPAPGTEGRIVEPGHQFEWAWLLLRWGRISGWPDAQAAARRLIEIGESHGSDVERGVTINALLDDFTVHDDGARLWPQTERIKAGAALAAAGDAEGWEIANRGAAALMRYLDTPVAGLWRDRMLPDGGFSDGPAPASSFYHIVCAIAEFDRAVQQASPQH